MLTTESYLMTFVPERFLTDEKYRRGHINILAPREGTRILGMHTPEMKLVAKQLVKSGEWEGQLPQWSDRETSDSGRETCDSNSKASNSKASNSKASSDGRRPLTGKDGLTHEERMIWGLVIDYVKVPLEERLEMIEEFIPAVDNWAICDNFCCNAHWVEKEDKERIWSFISGLIDSKEEFRARVGLILALAHFLDKDNLPRTIKAVADRAFSDEDPYYIRMGAAWLFAEALCKQYESTLPYIKSRRLSPWIHNKSIQKARESYRISEERKAELKSLR